ncbi:hypothetical protein PAMA_010920 [Pampus argenteus]
MMHDLAGERTLVHVSKGNTCNRCQEERCGGEGIQLVAVTKESTASSASTAKAGALVSDIWEREKEAVEGSGLSHDKIGLCVCQSVCLVDRSHCSPQRVDFPHVKTLRSGYDPVKPNHLGD